ncbi:A24 family peptidase [Candidatus Methylobacter oryzae]|uniref:Prepilin peptidase n=1 Tax=Candidatus Methylobacter oryzae TaxID=2497749 RepID=A0ABY3C4P1_9GAMM|nr:A24 family peptidase [Candidatus Methylobacter oryzae]TRW89696.1 prepilin peptidase [Candidatus Methylobacter oryzae]
MTLDNLPTAVLLIALIAAAAIDIKRHRLPNVLTVSTALLGIVFQCWLYGWSGFLNGLGGFCIGLFLLLPFYAMRWMGAGDVKLMAAVGIFLGWPYSLLAVALTTGAGAVAALGLLAAKGGLTNYLRRYGAMAKCLLLTGRVAYVPPEQEESSTLLFPYALAIALGTFATLAWAGRLDTFLDLLIGGVHV